jgi:diguanylate cyclase (GGDEF)-like protein
MISLREFIDSYRAGGDHTPAPASAAGDSVFDERAVAAFRSTLLSMGICGQRAVPAVGHGLTVRLAEINKGLAYAVTPEVLNKASKEATVELSRWAESAQQFHHENERQIQEIMGVLARAAEAMGARDATHSREVGQLTARMRAIAEMKELPAIRTSLLECATVLKICVGRMVEDGKESLRQLNAEVDGYRARLEESERAADLDALTKLTNRRGFEKHFREQLQQEKVFSLILLDLDGFKSVNDRYGHLAGDDLLRQFASELRGQCPPPDVVCRWGGDEFAIIVPADGKEAAERVERIRRWVLGEYRISDGFQPGKITVRAAIGAVQREGKETGPELLARADREMYRSKRHASGSAPAQNAQGGPDSGI